MQNQYSNRDFYLSGFLLASGYPLQDYFRTNGITTFIFNEDEDLINSVKSYYSMQAKIEPASYGNALRTLKSIIHSDKTSIQSNTNNEFRNNCKGTK
jgi:hypothetical protein